MKRDTIEKAIARGAGLTEEFAKENLRYEGYGPGGVGILVECLTDNRNRTVAQVRHTFSRAGCQLASEGAVAYLFERCGRILVGKTTHQTTLFDAAIDAGATDIREEEDGTTTITTIPENLDHLCAKLRSSNLEVHSASTSLIAAKSTRIDASDAASLLRLRTALEGLDDTLCVYSNEKNS